MTFYQDMPENSKVWIYQSNRPFREVEVDGIRHKLKTFLENWQAHGNNLIAFGDVYYSQFVVLMVDEKEAKASGCSIDTSVHFIEELGKIYEVDFFDRLSIAYVFENQVKVVSKNEFKQLLKSGELSNETIVFNNLIKNKLEFENKWKIPVKASWHKTLV